MKRDRLVLVVSLWLKGADIAAFEAFEQAAASCMAKHDGRIERVVRLDDAGDAQRPFEIHIVSFPDAAAFYAYREDPQMRALAAARERVIDRTVVHSGRDARPYIPA